MLAYHASASALIPAPPELVYGLIADYRETHPRILPRPPFTFLEVEAGGRGAGTAVRFGMQVMGRTQTFHSDIAEPEPGRVLVETVRSDGPVTTFKVDAADGGQHALVTIATEGRVRDGLLGRIERATTTMYLRRVYAKELQQLDELAKQRAQQPE